MSIRDELSGLATHSEQVPLIIAKSTTGELLLDSFEESECIFLRWLLEVGHFGEL